MEERVTYGEIRAWFLGSYYSYCRSKLRYKSRWIEGENEAGCAYDEFDNAFDMPIEKLMLEVLTLILYAGRASEKAQKYHLRAISELLNQIDLPTVLEDLPLDEAKDLRYDLEILGFMSAPRKTSPDCAPSKCPDKGIGDTEG